MDITEKYGLKFLNIKEILESNNKFLIKIIHIKDPDFENVCKIKNILKLPEKKELFFEKIDLHYLGEKENKRALLARCRNPDFCKLCNSSIKGFSKMFFYGIHNNEIVYFSLSMYAGFPVIQSVDKENINLAQINHKALFQFQQSINYSSGNNSVAFGGLIKDKEKKPNLALLEHIKKLPSLKNLLNEKYSKDWSDEILNAISKIKT